MRGLALGSNFTRITLLSLESCVRETNFFSSNVVKICVILPGVNFKRSRSSFIV